MINDEGKMIDVLQRNLTESSAYVCENYKSAKIVSMTGTLHCIIN